MSNITATLTAGEIIATYTEGNIIVEAVTGSPVSAVVAQSTALLQPLVDAAAASAAEASAGVEPVWDHENQAHLRALRRGGGWLVSNTLNHLRLQADGTYQSAGTSWAAEWDFAVTGGASFTADWIDVSGVTMTVEERDATTQIVAPVTVTTTATRRQYTATANASTTIVRVKLSGPSSGTTIVSPSVTEGKPETVPTDPNYLSLFMDRATALDGASLAAGVATTSATAGAINGVSGQTIDVASGTIFTADYDLSAVPQSDFVVVLELGTTFTPRECSVTPLLIGGGTGTAIDIMAYRWGEDNTRFIATVPASVGGVSTIGLRLAALAASGGGPNVGIGGATTFTLTPYNAAFVPAIQTVPIVTTNAITAEGLLTDAKIEASEATTTALINATQGFPYIGRLDRRFMDLADTSQFVDTAGNDVNSGAIRKLPVQTLTQAFTNGTTGDIVAVKAGQVHTITDATDRANVADFDIVSYDDGTSAPIIDRCNVVSTWTLVSGSSVSYEATVTLDEAATPQASLSSSNTFLPKVYADDVLLTPKWGGADIAANEATVEANEGSMTMHQVGSTAQDPRTDTSGTKLTYRIVVHLAGGANPNSADMRVSGANNIALFGDGNTYRSLQMRGAHGKDNISVESYDGEVTNIEDLTILDVGEHGGVGAVNVKGKLIAFGYPTPGRTGFSLGRGTSNAWNIFSAGFDVSGIDLSINHIELHNGDKVLYGHLSSGGTGYGSVTIGKLVGRNVSTGISFDDPNVSTSYIQNGTTIGEVDLEDCDNAFSVGGDLTVNGGSILFGEAVVSGNNQRLTHLTGTAPVQRFNNLEFKAALTYVQNVTSYTLARRDNLVTDTMPVVYFNNCTDLNQPDVRLAVPLRSNSADPRLTMILSRGGITNELFLHISNGTLLGDIMDQANGTNYPSGLYVGSGCVFGMGDRTRAEIRTALTGAGLTENETSANAATEGFFFIHDETWVVDRTGALIDVPVSLGGST